MDRYDFADGKYTVINDNGILTALRHGEPWERDLVGDNLVYWMLVEVLRLKEELNRGEVLLEALQADVNALSVAYGSAVVGRDALKAERDSLKAAAKNLIKHWDAKHVVSTTIAVGDLRTLLTPPHYEEQPDGSVIPVDPSEMQAVEQRCQLCKYEHGHSIGCENNPVDIAINALSHPKTEATTTWTIPHSLAGFRGAFESEHGRKPTEQEVWNAAIRSWRDLTAPTAWQDLPDNEIERILDTHAGSAASEYGGAFWAVVEAVSEALSKRNGGVR